MPKGDIIKFIKLLEKKIIIKINTNIQLKIKNIFTE